MRLIIATALTLMIPIAANAAENVRCVQEFLSKTAFNPGPIDGAWGRKTATALTEFTDQADISIDGGLGKGNATKVCEVFSEDTNGRLLAMGKYRSYEVDIDKGKLADIDPTFFDFSGFDLYDGEDLSCRFEFEREGPEADARWMRARGSLKVVNGYIQFASHNWSLGHDQLANQDYLYNLSNLAMLNSGQIVGRTPYFWSYIQEGAVSKRPVQATLTGGFTAAKALQSGDTRFDIPGHPSMNGVLEIIACW